MARIIEPTPEALASWDQWLDERKHLPALHAAATGWPPWNLYRMKSTQHRVTLYSYSEDGTVTVNVLGKYNFVTFERRVFGIPADDLEECDLPAPGELLGAMLGGPA